MEWDGLSLVGVRGRGVESRLVSAPYPYPVSVSLAFFSLSRRAAFAVALGATLSGSLVSVTAASVVEPYKVATWHGFREAAITYTFDDNTPNQFAVAVPMFNELDFRLTLYPVTNWNGGNWARLQAAVDAGHEVGSHTVSHPSLGPLSAERQIEEMEGAKTLIEANVTGQQVLTIAYPNCSVPNIELASSFYIAGRICSQQIVPATPSDYFRISSIICGSQGAVKTAADFETRAGQARTQGGWAVYLMHAIDGDSGYSPLASAVLRESLEFFDSRREIFWVDTFSNVVRYIQQREAVSLVELELTDSLIRLEITDELEDAVYDRPLTFRRALPEGWAGASVTQNGVAVPFQVTTIDAVPTLTFDAVPDAGEVRLLRTPDVIGATILEATTTNSLRLRVTGKSGARYTLHGSNDLLEWTVLETVELAAAVQEVIVEGIAAPRFLRLTPAE